MKENKIAQYQRLLWEKTRDQGKSETLKSKILAAAESFIMKKGIFSVKIDEIAEALKISKKTIYNHFKSKNMLFEEVLDNYFSNILVTLDSIMEDQNTDFLTKLALLMQFATQRLGNPDTAFIKDVQNFSPKKWNYVLTLFKSKIISITRILIKQGIEKKTIKEDVDKEILPFTIFRMIEGVFNPNAFYDIPVSPYDIFEVSLKIIFEGILTPSGIEFYQKNIKEVLNERD